MSPGAARLRRAAPTILAAALAAAYVIWSPASLDLAAHLFRVKLFRAEGFGLWDNWWYGGHHTLGYSVLFPAVAAALGPQLAAGLAAVGATAAFEILTRERFGARAWMGALWFAVGAAAELFSGRLTFAFGLLPALAAVLALARGWTALAGLLGVVTALVSPVAALFTALAGLAAAVGGLARGRPGRTQRRLAQARGRPGRRQRRLALARGRPGRTQRRSAQARGRPGRTHGIGAGIATAVASLAPIVILAVAFPEGGVEPFAFTALWPILAIAVLMLVVMPREFVTLRAGVILYAVGCVLAYAIPTAVGSNAVRLGTLVAGPVAALVLWDRRPALLGLVLIPLLYIQTQAAFRDVSQASGPATTAGYYRPLLGFLSREATPPNPPFRTEIPFTAEHWEAFEVAPRFALARGWERQLDIEDNPLFYDGRLSPARYEAWLYRVAVRFVAVPDTTLDYSARAEAALIDRGLPYLRLVWRSRHWRVYAVSDPTPIVTGAALRALGPDSLTIAASRPTTVEVRVRFTPYWALSGGAGCVAPDGEFTQVTLRHAGTVRLVIRFALDRIGARSPRCT
ncbi:MAG TPA: hypothetical protein VG275_04455 [Solirubrobacteraceae bacterium]|nr:hypothetical protein [Solirubrobacteraceae bacterium]